MNLKKMFRKSINQLEKTGSRPASDASEKDGLIRRIRPEKKTKVREAERMTCPACEHQALREDFARAYFVCPKCGHHLRMSARQRLAIVADQGTFQEMNDHLSSVDFLQFPGYAGKLEEARKKSGETEAVITGICEISGVAAALFIMEPNFMMGSMGSVVGEKITRLFEEATAKQLPVVGFSASGGARMQEGLTSLMQMAKTSAAARRHSDAGLFYLSVLTDPTSGGVTASFAMEGDVIISEPGALVAFAGPRVIEGTIRKKLPEGFQRAETVLAQGFLDQIVNRRNIKAYLRRILALHGGV